MKPTLSLEKLDLSKTLWRAENRRFWQFYCPFCSVTRRLALSPRPQPRHFAQVGVTSLFLMALAWPLFGIKGGVVFFPLWVGFEVLYRMRVRAEMSCQECGFDPYLYLSDIPRARRQMEEFWRQKRPSKPAEKPADSPLAP
jgi:hypothetical protein